MVMLVAAATARARHRNAYTASNRARKPFEGYVGRTIEDGLCSPTSYSSCASPRNQNFMIGPLWNAMFETNGPCRLGGAGGKKVSIA